MIGLLVAIVGLLVVLVVLVALLVWVASFELNRLLRIGISASDLNLKAHAELLNHFERLQRHE